MPCRCSLEGGSRVKEIDIGRLNKRVTFLQYGESTDSMGQSRQALLPVKKMWAELAPVKGGEFYEAQKLREEITYKVYVRHFKGVSSDMYIQYKDTLYEIKSVIDIDAAGRLLQIYCTEHKGKEVRQHV